MIIARPINQFGHANIAAILFSQLGVLLWVEGTLGGGCFFWVVGWGAVMV